MKNFSFLIFLISHSIFCQDYSFLQYNQKIAGKDYGLELVPIESGNFIMGSPNEEENRKLDEGPQHVVAVDSFWIAKYETTWDLYQLFMSRDIDKNQPNFNSRNEVNIEVDGVSEQIAKEALYKASAKLPIKTKTIKRFA